MWCRFERSKVGSTCTGYVAVERTEAALKHAVGTIGPIAVAIDSAKPSFRSYRGGVYNDPRCSKRSANHAVLVVGYGTHKGTKYWLIKNSWGTSWGLDGYMMLERDADNVCGICNYGSYPLV
ncbi:Digestive cysteine proteinase 1, partial [Lamellibrachia satsuma]